MENGFAEKGMEAQPTKQITNLRNQIRKLEAESRYSALRYSGDTEAVVSSGCSALDKILPAGGFPRGCLIEWIGEPGSSKPRTQNRTAKTRAAKTRAAKTRAAKTRKNRSQSATAQRELSSRTIDSKAFGDQARYDQARYDQVARNQVGTRRTGMLLPGSGVMNLAFLAAREACRDGGAFVILDPQKSFYPPAAFAWGFRSSQLVILQPSSTADLHWSIHQALSCPAIAAVWAAIEQLDEHTFRRFQLAAESSGCLGLFERPSQSIGQPSWAEIQLSIQPQPRSQFVTQPLPSPSFSSSAFSASDWRSAASCFPTIQHPRHFSANRFFKIGLLRSRQGQPGAHVCLEIDSHNGIARQATPLAQPGDRSLATNFPGLSTQLSRGSNRSHANTQSRSYTQSRSNTQSRSYTQSNSASSSQSPSHRLKRHHVSQSFSIQASTLQTTRARTIETSALPLATKLAHSKTRRRSTRA